MNFEEGCRQVEDSESVVSSSPGQEITNPICCRVLSKTQRVVVRIHTCLTAVLYAYYWTWLVWSIVETDSLAVFFFVPFLVFLLFDTLQHVWILSLVPRMSTCDTTSLVPRGLRVAMIVTKSPGEPFEIVERTLRGMMHQEGVEDLEVRDVWVADEDPSPHMQAFCAETGIRISTRKGIEEYHQTDWPRRTKCKEGNLSYFYDTYGRKYDVCFQFDADHVPSPTYLKNSVSLFADPRVAYIAFPNINERTPCWFGEARKVAEAFMYGVSQPAMGYGNDDGRFVMPTCTGSHYAVRIRALKEVGGIGPELDEDLSTTMMLAAAGYKGAYALDAIAGGDGPLSFADGVLQEFQWARSATILFLKWRHLIFPTKWQGLSLAFRRFSITYYYPSMLVWVLWITACPIVVGLSNWCASEDETCHLSAMNTFLHFAPLLVSHIGFRIAVGRNGWLRPTNVPLFHAGFLTFRIVRPFWNALGVAAGIMSMLTEKTCEFAVTAKRTGSASCRTSMGVSAVWPLLAYVGAQTIGFWMSAVFFPDAASIFALAFAVAVACACVWIVANHIRENGWRGAPSREKASLVLALVFLGACIVTPATVPIGRASIASIGNERMVVPTFDVIPYDFIILPGFGVIATVWGVALALAM